MLDLKTATTVPDPSALLPNSPANAQNEFKQIELATADVPGSNGKKRLARIGASVTNEEFRRWAIANNAWTMPFNVIMVEYDISCAPTEYVWTCANIYTGLHTAAPILPSATEEVSSTRLSVILSAKLNMSMQTGYTELCRTQNN